MTLGQFRKDLEIKGKPCELSVLQHIRIWDKRAYVIDGYDRGKDIVSPLTGKTFEVKNCQDAKINVPIEIKIVNRNGDHLSGLSVTLATYWVIFCKNAYHMILTDRLKDITKNIQEREYQIFDQRVTLKILPIIKLKESSTHIWSN